MTHLRISSFHWQWPGPTGMQHDECHAVFDGDTVVALCPERDVAERVLQSETLRRGGTVTVKTTAQKLRDDALARQSGREHLS